MTSPQGTNWNENQNNSPVINETNTSRAIWRRPLFWYDNPKEWFAQLEAQFAIMQTTTDKSRFDRLVCAIDGKVLTQVADAVENPPAQGKYEHMKARILEAFVAIQ
jgi:hypothetical protein